MEYSDIMYNNYVRYYLSCLNYLCCYGRIPKTKTGVIINHIEDLGFEEYNELVKYLKIQNKSMCCG